MNNTTSIIHQIIRERRSIKPDNFNDQKVSTADLHQILENANWAPTHALTEPWHFVIFQEEGIQKLCDFESNYYKSKTPEEKFVQSKYDKYKNRALKASFVIAICMERKLEGKKIIPEVEELAATACAVQNMMLTAQAMGISTYWGSGGSTYSDELKSFLKLKEADKCLGFLYIGYSDFQAKGKRITGIESKIRWVS